MNVQMQTNGLSIFAGSTSQTENKEGSQLNSSSGQGGSKSVFAGGLHMTTDRMEQKRDMARKRAMRVLEDEFSNEKDIDAMIEEQKQKNAELKEEFQQNAEALKDVKAAEEQYKAEHGLDKEGAVASPEQQAELVEFNKAKAELNSRMISAREEAKARNKAVDNVMIEREKSHGMVDAQKEADEIMEDAGREIIGMLTDEVKEHIDEKMEEEKEKAEEIKEKKEEQEEKTEKNKTPQEISASHTTEVMGNLQDVSQEYTLLKNDLKAMLDTQEITEEDIKGLLTDFQL